MADNKLRCALVLRLEEGRGSPTPIPLAKLDHAGQYESSGGKSSLYGRDADFSKAVCDVISKDPPGGLAQSGSIGGFKVVQSDAHQVVFGADKDGICYAVITDLSYPSRVAIQFLEDLAKEFSAKFSDKLSEAKENSLTSKGKSILSALCKKYEEPSNVDKASKVLDKVEGVKTVMQDNIANMLKNTETTESLAEKSDQLNEQAQVFKKKAVDLKKAMWWKNIKMNLILGAVVLIILILILVPVIKRLK